jgi:hypothetical protein
VRITLLLRFSGAQLTISATAFAIRFDSLLVYLDTPGPYQCVEYPLAALSRITVAD